MHYKLFLLPVTISILFFSQLSHGGLLKYITDMGNWVVAQRHTALAERRYSNLSAEQEQQLERILPIIGAHEALSTIYENQERWSYERATKDYHLVALLPGLLVSTQMWRSINFKSKTDGLIACALLGLATWFSTSECMKRYPARSCQFFPNVFIPRFCLWMYETACKLGCHCSTISPQVMRTLYHKTNGIHDVADRTKQFARDLDSIVGNKRN